MTLTPSAAALLEHLRSTTIPYEGVCVKMEVLAARLGYSRRTIIRAVILLKGDNLLETRRQTWGKGYRAPHWYTVTPAGRALDVTLDVTKGVTTEGLKEAPAVPEPDVTTEAARRLTSHKPSDYVVEELRSSPTCDMKVPSRLSLAPAIDNMRTAAPFTSDACGARRGDHPVLTWEDEDTSGGIGLLWEDMQPKPKSRRIRPRSERPQSDWTAKEVTMAFVEKFESMMPEYSGFITNYKNAVLLAQFRKRLKTDGEIEMALVDLFLDDEKTRIRIHKDPRAAFRMWLGAWTRLLPRAREKAAQGARTAAQGPSTGDPVREPVSVVVDDSRPLLHASDGTTFPDTPTGRAQCKMHERMLVLQ